VYIITAPGLAPKEGFTPQFAGGAAGKIEKRVGELRGDYNNIVSQVGAMVEDSKTAQKASGLHISEVAVCLGFDASGTLGFVSAGVSASITITLAP
jgi:hypothetical protein